jgi:hypothetical protein
VLVGHSDVGHQLFGTDTPSAAPSSRPISLRPARSFDPKGTDGEENDVQLPKLEDGDAATTWPTDRYNTAQFGGLKTGVGVIIPVAPGTTLGSMTVDSPTSGWKASVYVADSAATTLAGWGAPVGTLSGKGKVDLGRRKGGAVLLWITDLGPAHRVEIGEVRLST